MVNCFHTRLWHPHWISEEHYTGTISLQIVSEWAQLPLARLFFALKVDEADWDGLSGTPNFHVLCPRHCPFMSFLDGRRFAKQTSWALPVMLTSRMLLHCSFAKQACWFMFSVISSFVNSCEAKLLTDSNGSQESWLHRLSAKDAISYIASPPAH